MRVQVKRASKKKSGYEVEKRDDGYYYREFDRLLAITKIRN